MPVPPSSRGTGPETAPPRLGIALSGGGFRAASFHLGVLKRLEELGLIHRVEALSTVSGGSIVGALFALRCAERGGTPGSYSIDELMAEMRPFLTENLRAKALFGNPWRAVRTAASILFPRVSRVGLLVEELDRQLFHGRTLNELPPWIAINATNLRTGKGWRFLNDRAGDYLAGATEHTRTIRIAEAVAASAAYPGVADSYAFHTRWEALRGDILSEGRWERPPDSSSRRISRWRERYGEPRGKVRFPLVDGGLYDNEGVNALRGHRVTHAIISAVAPPETDTEQGFGPSRLFRIIEVMHDRLGAATRQLTHEMTHGVDPADAATRLNELAAELRHASHNEGLPADVRTVLTRSADEATALATVGAPPRGPQFRASAQILLHRDDLAENVFAAPSKGGHDVPARYRGLDSAVVAELSRVRTDLDALEPRIVDLLIAQGYFLADFMVKLTMPDLVFREGTGLRWYDAGLTPEWEWAHAAVESTITERTAILAELRTASIRMLPIGRVRMRHLGVIARLNLALVLAPVAAAGVLVCGYVGYDLWRGSSAIISYILRYLRPSGTL